MNLKTYIRYKLLNVVLFDNNRMYSNLNKKLHYKLKQQLYWQLGRILDQLTHDIKKTI